MYTLPTKAQNNAVVIILGAGLIGRLIAHALAKADINVLLFDAGGPNGEASAAFMAAAMLAPITEALRTEPEVLQLAQASLPLWQPLINSLPMPVFYQREGSIVLWHPRNNAEARIFQQNLAIRLPQAFNHRAPTSLMHTELVKLEPELDTQFTQGFYLPEEGQLDNRTLLKALTCALMAQPKVRCHWYQHTTVEHCIGQGQYLVDCRGFGAKNHWNRPLAYLPKASKLRGVRGEIIRIIAPKVKLTRPIHLLHPRYPLYCVPKPEGIFVVGASEIESEDISPISVRSTLELLSALISIHPGFSEARIVELNQCCRPTLSHHRPEIRCATNGPLIEVNGLYRHGFLIGPIVAQAVAQFILMRLNQPHNHRQIIAWQQAHAFPNLFTLWEDL